MTDYRKKTEDNEGRIIKPIVFNTVSDGSGDSFFPGGTTALGNVGHNKTTITDGRTIVTTAGVAKVLTTSTVAKLVVITAETDNTDIVVIGGSTVVASLSTRRGTPLLAGDSITLEIDNLADVYVDAAGSAACGDGVTYVALN